MTVKCYFYSFPVVLVSEYVDGEEDLVFIITGANSGIGKETAIQVSLFSSRRTNINAKTTIILACRTLACRTAERAKEVQDEIIVHVK